MNDNDASRILVVDDEPLNRELLDGILSPCGYDVRLAAGGAEAIDIVRRDGADLVLLDVMMPGLDGFAVFETMRDRLGRRDLPVVFVTARGDREARLRGKECGADDFVTKPIDAAELLARVKRLLETKSMRDESERVRREVETQLDAAREELLRADRLVSLGTLAAGVGHEINNAVTSMLSVASELRRNLAAGQAPIAADLDDLDLAISHVRAHGKNLLEVGRPGPAIDETLDLAECCDRALKLLSTAGRTRRAEVTFDRGESAALVHSNRVKLEQVLVNLVGNAADALEGVTGRAREIRIALRADRARNVAQIEIADSGCGIPADKLQTIWQPYYTTKAPGKGTGLGLPVVRRIVEQAGGVVSVESREGAGTKFVVELPLAPT